MKTSLPVSIIAICAASAAFGGSLTPAVEDPAPVVPMVAPAADWSGFYFGVLGGFQNGDLTTPGPVFDVEATNYGGFAGYNFQEGSIVYGAEIAGQVGDATINGLAFDLDYLVDARARIGYAFDNVLVFGAGGYTMAQATRGGTSLDMTGFNVGLGAEIEVSDHFVLGGEYIYRGLSGTTGGISYDYDTHAFQLRASYRF